MARKFALYLKGEHEVRNNIEEIREYFDYGKIVEYFYDGSLLQWLKDRDYPDAANKLKCLKGDELDFKTKLCHIFNIDENKIEKDNAIEDTEIINKRNMVKQYTVDEAILNDIEKVVTNQNELQILLERKEPTIYLLTGEYVIPLEVEDVAYIGIGEVTAVIESAEIIDFSKRNILFKNISFNDEYMELCKNMYSEKVKNIFSDEVIAELCSIIINGRLEDGTEIWQKEGKCYDKDFVAFEYTCWDESYTRGKCRWLSEPFWFMIREYNERTIGMCYNPNILDSSQYIVFTTKRIYIQDERGNWHYCRYDKINNVKLRSNVVSIEQEDGSKWKLPDSSLWTKKLGGNCLRLFLLLMGRLVGKSKYVFLENEKKMLELIKLESLEGEGVFDYLKK